MLIIMSPSLPVKPTKARKPSIRDGYIPHHKKYTCMPDATEILHTNILTLIDFQGQGQYVVIYYLIIYAIHLSITQLNLVQLL